MQCLLIFFFGIINTTMDDFIWFVNLHQFFICFEGCGHLTGQYTVWGQVERGMENVYNIAPGEPPASPDQIVSARVID